MFRMFFAKTCFSSLKSKEVMLEGLRIDWLREATPVCLAFVLREYRYLVHRFPLWLALVFARAQREEVREALRKNLYDEVGVPPTSSHLQLLDACLLSCGVAWGGSEAVSRETRRIEEWFVGVCGRESSYRALCVLGPGTEAVSEAFLLPLEDAIMGAFHDHEIDLRYFYIHRKEVDAEHARSIEAAMAVIEADAVGTDQLTLLIEERKTWVEATMAKHRAFWENVHRESQIRRLLQSV